MIRGKIIYRIVHGRRTVVFCHAYVRGRIMSYGMKEPAVERISRILHVFGSLDVGGAEVMIMNLYRNIDRSRVQFDFIVHTDDHGHFEDEIALLGGLVHRVPRFTGFNFLRYRKAWKDFFNSHPEYRIIHGHVTSSSAIYLGIAKQHHVYTIAHSHSVRMFHGLKGFMDIVLSYPTRWIADYCLACSRPAGIARFGRKIVSSDRFEIMKNALKLTTLVYDPIVRDTYRARLGLEGKFVIGNVGRFDPMKNHAFLLELFSMIQRKDPNTMLLLVGDGEQRPAIEAQIKSLHLETSVLLLGIRDDAPDLLQVMDVFVFPSFAEGLGISVLEAQATGLPCVVSSNVPGEVKLTDLVEFLDLKEPKDVWVDMIMKKGEGCERTSHTEALTAHGYDVMKTARYLQAFYLDTKPRNKSKNS